MNTMVTWTSPKALAPAQRRTFEDLLSYCLPEGSEVRCEHRESDTLVRYAEPPNDAADTAVALLEEAHARASLATAREPKELLDLGDAPAVPRPAADATWVGPGLQVAGPGLARLTRALDTVFLGLAQEAGAAEHAVPHLVSWDTIHRAGYTRNFPQHLTACSVVGPDLRALDRFAGSADLVSASAELTPAEVVLAPAVCMNLFAALADRPLAGPVTMTARGMCGRYEAGADRTPTRLWSFDMREVVFLGDRAATRTFRDTMLDAVADLARLLGLPCTLAAANDPFFTSEREELLGYQSAFDLKHELKGRMADGTAPVAVTSVNLHNQHFGSQFGIALPDGAPAYSACIGFGLDRWARWLHGHLGDDPRDWPELLRSAAAPVGLPGLRREDR
ncbi:hypothetical protein ABZW18_22080 [Streptomyces sp. NPDC004647]|uniref:hypothetical protein n=1 Tax=Streptomyces sp. NPDC004647 TaxID=3154671 RepID=UPI0033AE7CED